MKKSKTTRLVLVNDRDAVAGIVTRRDIQRARTRMQPTEPFRMRVGSPRDSMLVEEEITEHLGPVRDVATHLVVTAREDENRLVMLRRMVEKDVPSIVLVSADDRPKGLVSMRSLLTALAAERHRGPVPVLVHHQPHGLVGEQTVRELEATLEPFGTKLHRRAPVHWIEVYLEPVKDAAGKMKESEVVLRVQFWSGASYLAKAAWHIARVKHLGLLTALHAAMREVEEQIERDHHVKHHHGAARERTAQEREESARQD